MENHRIGDLIVIDRVDSYGYLGRDRHPLDRHEGRMAVVTDIEVFVECPPSFEVIYHAGRSLQFPRDCPEV